MVKTSLNTRLFTKSKSRRKDWISCLPDDLLREILSYLSTKDSVRTSVLSKRWKNVWLVVPALDLDSNRFEDDYDFWKFMDKFIKPMKKADLTLKRFRLIYDAVEHNQSGFVSRIDEVINRRVLHLTIVSNFDEKESVRLPLSLYSCATLVSLALYCVVFDAPKSEVVVYLPFLKTMHLDSVRYDGDEVLKTLISNSPVLEELTIITDPDDNFLEVIRVRSQSLKSFTLRSRDLDSKDPDVEINAPILEYMSISDYQSDKFKIHNIGPFARVHIDLIFDVDYNDTSKKANFRRFFTKISTVHEMIISNRTLEVIYGYSKLKKFHEFSNLFHLDVSFAGTSCEFLPTILGCCSNLHSLILEFDYVPGDIKLSYVPPCFSSSLEFVRLETPSTFEETSSMMKLAIYFVRNCMVLKKLMVSESFENILAKIKRIPKNSSGCKIVML